MAGGLDRSDIDYGQSEITRRRFVDARCRYARINQGVTQLFGERLALGKEYLGGVLFDGNCYFEDGPTPVERGNGRERADLAFRRFRLGRDLRMENRHRGLLA